MKQFINIFKNIYKHTAKENHFMFSIKMCPEYFQCLILYVMYVLPFFYVLFSKDTLGPLSYEIML